MENEKRLIDANALSDKVDESKHDNPHPQGMIRVNHRNEHDHFLRMIMDAPTVDAVEVAHGHWIDDRTNIICSNCGAEYSDEIVFMNRNFKYENLNYCPNCGARMDGDSK